MTRTPILRGTACTVALAALLVPAGIAQTAGATPAPTASAEQRFGPIATHVPGHPAPAAFRLFSTASALTEKAVAEQERAEAKKAAAAKARAQAKAKARAQAKAKAKARAEAKAKAARRAKAERAARASRSVARTSGSPRDIARSLVAARGWSAEQFGCLDKLWTKESGWTVTADNPTSSAYGIPQALPGSRMASHGADWRTNPATQIRWGLDYISDRYGKPCAAWAHSRANNWY